MSAENLSWTNKKSTDSAVNKTNYIYIYNIYNIYIIYIYNNIYIYIYIMTSIPHLALSNMCDESKIFWFFILHSTFFCIEQKNIKYALSPLKTP